jgi:HSP90 family molecular chaperone
MSNDITVYIKSKCIKSGFVTDNVEELYQIFFLGKGVIDSPDIPLNVSLVQDYRLIVM